MVEILVAMFVIVTVMVAMLSVLVSSLGTIVQSRQRQTATALATQAIEQLRALPYDAVVLPDGSLPDSTLQHTQVVGPNYLFNAHDVLSGVSNQQEPLVVNAWSGRDRAQTVDEITYRVQTYVTRAPIAGTQQTYFLTVVVSWTSQVSPQGRTIAQRSVAYSPPGCLSTSNSPFAAPCQAYLTAQAGQTYAGVTVSNDRDSTLAIEGFSGTLLDLTLPANGASLIVEQTASANASAQTSGVRMLGPPDGTSGGMSATASVDSDPSSAAGMQATASTPGQSSSTQTLTGTGGSLRVRPLSGDSGAAAAAILADGTYCTGMSGSPLATGSAGQLRPCASSRIQPSGTAGVVEYLPTGLGWLAVELARVEASPVARSVAAQIAGVANAAEPNGGACAAGAGPVAEGCAYGAARRDLSLFRLGAPGTTGIGPSGFDGRGVVTVTGLSETVRAEEGNGARSPFYTRSGTLSVWNGSGYTTINLADYAAPPTGLQPASEEWLLPRDLDDNPLTVVAYAGPSGRAVVLTFDGSVIVQRPQFEYTPNTRTGDPVKDCDDAACVTQVNGGAVVVVNVTVTVSRDGAVIGRFGMASSVGGVGAQASYKAAADE